MLVAGAGSNDTAHAVRIGAGSQQAGAQGLLINAFYYNRPSVEGVYCHIMAVIASFSGSWTFASWTPCPSAGRTSCCYTKGNPCSSDYRIRYIQYSR